MIGAESSCPLPQIYDQSNLPSFNEWINQSDTQSRLGALPNAPIAPDYGDERQRWDYLTRVFDKHFYEAYRDQERRRTHIQPILDEMKGSCP